MNELENRTHWTTPRLKEPSAISSFVNFPYIPFLYHLHNLGTIVVLLRKDPILGIQSGLLQPHQLNPCNSNYPQGQRA